MDWSFDHVLYSKLQIWELICENILEAGFVTLPDSRKCETILRWLRDQGLVMLLCDFKEQGVIQIGTPKGQDLL